MFIGRGNKREAVSRIIALRIILTEGDLKDPYHFDKAIENLAELTYSIGGIGTMNVVQNYMDIMRRNDRINADLIGERSDNNAEANKS